MFDVTMKSNTIFTLCFICLWLFITIFALAAPGSDLVGKWRSISIEQNSSVDTAPKAWEIEFSADGTFRETIDEGFGIAFEHTGIYQVKESTLLLKQTWRSKPLDLQYSVESKKLFLFEPKVLKWKVEFERSKDPLAALVKLPRVPRTVKEAVATLRQIMKTDDLETIQRMKEDELILLHHGFGTYIRNAFGLWRGNKILRQSCGAANMHPDAASGVIIYALWKSLQSSDSQ
jgi:hypothetical protein